jgi:hypothetical protein
LSLIPLTPSPIRKNRKELFQHRCLNEFYNFLFHASVFSLSSSQYLTCQMQIEFPFLCSAFFS